MPTSKVACSPSSLIMAFTSRSDFSHHFLDPSPDVSFRQRSVFQADSLAISLLTGSNPDRITASGVSSIIRSMPVSVSMARMFRAFSSDDTTLHLIVRKRHNRDCGFRNVIGRTSLDGSSDYLLRLLVRVFLCLALDILVQERRVASCFLFYLLQYDLPSPVRWSIRRSSLTHPAVF